MSAFFFFNKEISHSSAYASMLSSRNEKLVRREVHTALVNPWEWAECLNIIHYVGVSGEFKSCRGSPGLGK